MLSRSQETTEPKRSSGIHLFVKRGKREIFFYSKGVGARSKQYREGSCSRGWTIVSGASIFLVGRGRKSAKTARRRAPFFFSLLVVAVSRTRLRSNQQKRLLSLSLSRCRRHRCRRQGGSQERRLRTLTRATLIKIIASKETEEADKGGRVKESCSSSSSCGADERFCLDSERRRGRCIAPIPSWTPPMSREHAGGARMRRARALQKMEPRGGVSFFIFLVRSDKQMCWGGMLRRAADEQAHALSLSLPRGLEIPSLSCERQEIFDEQRAATSKEGTRPGKESAEAGSIEPRKNKTLRISSG